MCMFFAKTIFIFLGSHDLNGSYNQETIEIFLQNQGYGLGGRTGQNLEKKGDLSSDEISFFFFFKHKGCVNVSSEVKHKGNRQIIPKGTTQYLYFTIVHRCW